MTDLNAPAVTPPGFMKLVTFATALDRNPSTPVFVPTDLLTLSLLLPEVGERRRVSSFARSRRRRLQHLLGERLEGFQQRRQVGGQRDEQVPEELHVRRGGLSP